MPSPVDWHFQEGNETRCGVRFVARYIVVGVVGRVAAAFDFPWNKWKCRADEGFFIAVGAAFRASIILWNGDRRSISGLPERRYRSGIWYSRLLAISRTSDFYTLLSFQSEKFKQNLLCAVYAFRYLLILYRKRMVYMIVNFENDAC